MICQGKISFPFSAGTKLVMIAVGVGIAPMLQILRNVFKHVDAVRKQQAAEEQDQEHQYQCTASERDSGPTSEQENPSANVSASELEQMQEKQDKKKKNSSHVEKIVLLFGVVS